MHQAWKGLFRTSLGVVDRAGILLAAAQCRAPMRRQPQSAIRRSVSAILAGLCTKVRFRGSIPRALQLARRLAVAATRAVAASRTAQRTQTLTPPLLPRAND